MYPCRTSITAIGRDDEPTKRVAEKKPNKGTGDESDWKLMIRAGYAARYSVSKVLTLRD